MGSYEEFEALPRRVFLDSCAVQTLGQYGGFLWEGEPLPEGDPIHKVASGVANQQRLPKNSAHLEREPNILVLQPVDYWAMLQPWADLYR